MRAFNTEIRVDLLTQAGWEMTMNTTTTITILSLLRQQIVGSEHPWLDILFLPIACE